jgi:hypothetical protein
MLQNNNRIFGHFTAAPGLFVLLSAAVWMLPQTARTTGLPRQADAHEQKEEFELLLAGSYSMPDGTFMGFRIFKARDGSRADIKFGEHDAPDQATSQCQFWRSSPLQIMQEKEKKDSAGKVVGRRTVALFKDLDGKRFFRVIWTEGPKCYVIGSVSLKTALQLERWVESGS